MTEITTCFDPMLSRAFPRLRLEVNEDMILATIARLGEDVTADNPPVHGAFGRASLRAVGNADIHDDGVRRFTVAAQNYAIPGIPYYVWCSEKQINETVLHELVHIVDVLDPELMEQQEAYWAKHFDRRTMLGRAAALAARSEASAYESPMELRAHTIVDQYRKAREVPRIVRIVRRGAEQSVN